jgi:penicillin-binding protein 1C
MGPAEFVFPVAVKTGTSQDYRDAWTIAYSPKFVVGAWVGRADAGPMQAMGGMGSAAELVHDVLLALHKDPTHRRDGLAFPAPAAHRPVDVCSGNRCTSVFREWVPTEGLESADHVLVDRRTGTLATQATADDDVIEERVPMPVDWRPLARARARDSVRIDILSPENGARLLHNPDQPAEAETVALRAAVTGPFRTLAWYIDGRLYSTVGSTEALRWPLQPGIHKFQALLPGRPESSGVVTIMVVGD